MEILKVSLKQHTPLLHFQPNEPGATLRASEVKPRLDRYIIEHEGNGPYDTVKDRVKETHASWFIDKDGIHALNYSMRIIVKGIAPEVKLREKSPKTKPNKETKKPEVYYQLSNFPLVLSNMGGKTDKEKLANLSYTQQQVDLIFIVSDKKKDTTNENTDNLLAVIERHIVSFFAQNNFGQRSGKGFGSFLVSRINNKAVSVPTPSDCYIKYNYKGGYREDRNFTDFLDLFTVIDVYWKKYLELKSNKDTGNFRQTGISDRRQKGDSEQRIPSLVIFKPIFKEREVFIYILLNKKVIECVHEKFNYKNCDVSTHLKEVQNRINALHSQNLFVPCKRQNEDIKVTMSQNSWII